MNNNILYESQNPLGSTAGDVSFASEVMNYVIIQTGAENIMTGEPSEYTFIANIRGNGAFWPDPFDSLANNLFADTQHGKSHASLNPLPGGLAGVQPNDLNHIEKPVKGKTGWEKFKDGIKKVGKSIWSHRDQIMGVIEGASMLLAA